MKKLRIIYAEDSLAEQEQLTKILSTRGHDVVCCDNGRAALQAILAQPFDVLVTDNDMPGMNGLALVRELRRLENPIKIVVTSGYLEPEVEAGYRVLGIERFLPKPSPNEKIFRAIESDQVAMAAPSIVGNEAFFSLHSVAPNWEQGWRFFASEWRG